MLNPHVPIFHRQYFSDAQLAELTPLLQVEQATGLQYYPLPQPGERFPVNDPNLQPILEPRPPEDHVFLQGTWLARVAG